MGVERTSHSFGSSAASVGMVNGYRVDPRTVEKLRKEGKSLEPGPGLAVVDFVRAERSDPKSGHTHTTVPVYGPVNASPASQAPRDSFERPSAPNNAQPQYAQPQQATQAGQGLDVNALLQTLMSLLPAFVSSLLSANQGNGATPPACETPPPPTHCAPPSQISVPEHPIYSQPTEPPPVAPAPTTPVQPLINTPEPAPAAPAGY